MWLKLVLLCIFGCTKSLTNSFDLGGVMSGNRMAGVPLGRGPADGELDVEGICSGPGMACQNCSHAVNCVALPMGWLKMPLQECTDGLSCNAREGRCSDQAVPECDVVGQKYQHTCEQVGIFPDAFDCRKFHLCSPPDGLPDGRPAEHRVALCPRHYGYNPRIAQCSIKLDNGQCSEKPVPECTTLGQTNALSSGPNHYYVCLSRHDILYPQVFICPHGWFFWDGSCRPEPQIINTTDRNTEERYTGPHDNGHMGPDYGQNGHMGPDNGNIGLDNGHNGNMGPDNGNMGPENGHMGPGNSYMGPYKGHMGAYDNHLGSNEKPYESNEGPSGPDDKYIPYKDKSPTTTRIESFFSTDKATTYAPDTFLADKFDIANYESTDDVAPPIDEFTNSFESGVDFW